MAFKMKGSSLYGKINLNRGGQANRPDGRAKSSAFQKDTDPVTQGGVKETVDVSGGNKTERHSDKYARVKKETDAMEKGDNKGRLANLAKEYGGTWTREDRSGKGGSKGTFVNERGETVQQVAINQGQAASKNKKEYLAKNTTKKPGAPKTGSFVTEIDELTGEAKERRVSYEDAKKAEERGETTRHTNKEFFKNMAETRKDLNTPESIAAHDKTVSDSKKADAEAKNKSRKTNKNAYVKNQKIDAAAQREIENKNLTDAEKRRLELARSVGTDTDKSVKSKLSVVKTSNQKYKDGGPTVDSKKTYKGSRDKSYRDEQYIKTGESNIATPQSDVISRAKRDGNVVTPSHKKKKKK